MRLDTVIWIEETIDRQDGLRLWYQRTGRSHLLGLYFIFSEQSECMIGKFYGFFRRSTFSFSLYEPKGELDYEKYLQTRASLIVPMTKCY